MNQPILLEKNTEILFPENTLKEMAKKLVFYEQYSVEEYYIYDQQENRFLTYVELSQKIKDTETQLEQEKQRAEPAENRVKFLEQKLKALGIES